MTEQPSEPIPTPPTDPTDPMPEPRNPDAPLHDGDMPAPYPDDTPGGALEEASDD